MDGSKFDEFKAFYGDTLVTGMWNVIFPFLQHKESFFFLLCNTATSLFDLHYLLVQDFQEYLVTLLELLATTESCFQSLRKR